jgi:cytochrome c oxidase cbb3-type subunit 3
MFLVFTASFILGNVFAQQQPPASTQGPSPDQLIRLPIGGTHIPVDAKPPQISNPYEGDKDAIAEGKKMFNAMNCIGCHAPQGGGGMGPPLSDKDWIYGGEPGQIYLTIMQGRPNGMPSFAAFLPSDSAWKLVAYVHSLSNPGPASPQEKRAR